MIYRELKFLNIYNWGGVIIFDADLAAGLRLVAEVLLVYIWLDFIIGICVLESAKVQSIVETTEDFGCFF